MKKCCFVEKCVYNECPESIYWMGVEKEETARAGKPTFSPIFSKGLPNCSPKVDIILNRGISPKVFHNPHFYTQFSFSHLSQKFQ